MNVLHEGQISYEESLVLSLSLNFVPRPRKSYQDIFTEAAGKFIRQVRIKKHFATIPNSDTSMSIETILHTRINKSLILKELQATVEPVTTRSPIERYMDIVKKQL